MFKLVSSVMFMIYVHLDSWNLTHEFMVQIDTLLQCHKLVLSNMCMCCYISNMYPDLFFIQFIFYAQYYCTPNMFSGLFCMEWCVAQHITFFAIILKLK